MASEPFTSCVFCGVPCDVAGCDLHHLQKRSLRPDLVDDPSNVVLLCRRCHERTEADSGFAQMLRTVYGGNDDE